MEYGLWPALDADAKGIPRRALKARSISPLAGGVNLRSGAEMDQ